MFSLNLTQVEEKQTEKVLHSLLGNDIRRIAELNPPVCYSGEIFQTNSGLVLLILLAHSSGTLDLQTLETNSFLSMKRSVLTLQNSIRPQYMRYENK